MVCSIGIDNIGHSS